MVRPFADVTASPDEVAATRPGDDLVEIADVVMDRAFSVAADPEAVWPWLLQLGKGRAGWYLPRPVERFVPRRRRAIRRLDPQWLGLAVGERIPDYGGPREYFEVVEVDPGRHLLYRSQRGRTQLSWAIQLSPINLSSINLGSINLGSIDLGEERAAGSEVVGTRVHLRLRLAPVRRRWLATTVGDLFDALTIAGMAAGLRERLRERV